MTLTELIERLQAARGPDRDLSNAVACAIGWDHREHVKNDFKWLGPDEQAYLTPPHYTASVDSALTLIPIEKDVAAAWLPEMMLGHAHDGLVWSVLLANAAMDAGNHARHPSLPVAICIAALWARAA